jgi:hypothetical protein
MSSSKKAAYVGGFLVLAVLQNLPFLRWTSPANRPKAVIADKES